MDDLAVLQQQRVFWIAYYMDADMSLGAGRLPSLSPRLVNVEPPGDVLPDSAGEVNATGGEFRVNIFQLRVQLALLQAELMEYILAPPTSPNHAQPDQASLQLLAAKLDNWRQHWLFNLDVDNLRNVLHRSDLVHVLVLESAYFSTAYAVRVHVSSPSAVRDNPFSAAGLTADRSKEKSPLSHLDARRFLAFLQSVSIDDVPGNCLTLEAIVSAVVVILTHVMFNPREQNANADMAVARPVLQMLYRLIDLRKDVELSGIQNLCADLYLRAESALREDASFRP